MTNKMTVSIKLVSDPAEIVGIFKLHQANLSTTLSAEEAANEGFLSAQYDLNFLQRMNQISPAVIAVTNDVVVGYVLVATTDVRHEHPLLADLFNTIDRWPFEGGVLGNRRYLVCGQLCVAKAYRGMGLVQHMYGYLARELSDQFDCVITDVALNNPRSLRAHLKSGFIVCGQVPYGDIDWYLVLCDWRQRLVS